MTYLQPVVPLLLLLLAVACFRWPSRRWRMVAAAALAALFLWAWPPFSSLFAATLESFYTPGRMPPADAAAIVVLSASVVPANASQPEPAAGESTYLRCSYAAWLYQHWRQVPVLATGGSTGSGLIIAHVMRDLLQSQGVPAGMILTEERSTSTYENAAFSARILRGRGISKIALVTEAYHMLRSEKSFRKQGLEVAPAPCCFHTLEFEWSIAGVLPDARAIQTDGDYLHEWVGLLWYRLSGKI